MDMVHSPFAPRRNRSSANDENVVKPPQNPVINSTFSPGVITLVLPTRPNINPIMKQPIIFTKNVPTGNRPWNIAAHQRPIKYLPQVPTNPPQPAIIIAFIISLFVLCDL